MASSKHLRLAVGLAAYVLLALCLTACAAIFNPRGQDVQVTADAPEAAVWVDGERQGTAPTVVHLTTNQRHEIVVRTDTQSRMWVLEPTVSATGGAGLAGDVLILIPAGYVSLVGFGATTIPGNPVWGGTLALGIGGAAVALAPIVIDLSTNNLYELVPGTLHATFD